LVHVDGTAGSTSFTDSSLANNTLTAHSTTVTATSKFGSGAMNFTASSAAYIDTGANGIFHISTNPFTVEAWAYFTSVPGADAIIAAKWFYGSSDFSTAWRFGYVSGSLAFQYSNTGYDNFNLTCTWTPPLNAWHHVAVDRDASNTIRLYLDGVVVATTSSSVNIIEGGHPTFIGNDGALASGFTGYLDEVRVSRFKALYAGAFTPPSAPFDPYPTTGPLAQNAQTLSATGTVGAASSTGTLVVTQASQTLVATAVVTVGATLGVTQAAQTLAATGWSAAFGPIAATQAPHTLVALGVDVLGGTLVVTQAPQTLAAAGSPRVGGTLGITQASQSLTAVGSPSVGGTLGVTQATQTLAAAGWRAATGTLAVTQAPQTLAGLGSAVTGTSGSLIVTQAPQTLSASATLGGVTGALGLTQAPQTLLGIGTVIPVVSGTLTLTQAPQILAGIGAVTPTISGTLNLTQEEQILVATAVVFTPSAVTTQARVLVMA
jgi:hypothetical protein